MRAEPTPEFLVKFSSEHLARTLEIFFATAKETFRADTEYNLNVKSALMDSFRIQARALLFFLYSTNPKPDDSIAQDFMKAGVDWEVARPPRTDLLVRIQKRIGKEVAHITYTAPFYDENDEGWNFGAIMADIWKVFDVFIHLADEQKLHQHVNETHKFWLGVFLRDSTFTVDPSSYSVTMWTDIRSTE